MLRKHILIFLCVLLSNFLLTHQQKDQQRESRKLLILKLLSSLTSLGWSANNLIENVSVDKLSIAINQINRIKICQSENIQSATITALPGQDSTSPCRVFCKEDLGLGPLGIRNVRYFVAFVPNTTPCLIGNSIIPLGVCTEGICVARVVAPVASGTGVATLTANNKAIDSQNINSTKIIE